MSEQLDEDENILHRCSNADCGRLLDYHEQSVGLCYGCAQARRQRFADETDIDYQERLDREGLS